MSAAAGVMRRGRHAMMLTSPRQNPAATSAEAPRAAPAKSPNDPVTILCMRLLLFCAAHPALSSVVPNAASKAGRRVGGAPFPLSEKP
jgi:hypothetical protein